MNAGCAGSQCGDLSRPASKPVPRAARQHTGGVGQRVRRGGRAVLRLEAPHEAPQAGGLGRGQAGAGPASPDWPKHGLRPGPQPGPQTLPRLHPLLTREVQPRRGGGGVPRPPRGRPEPRMGRPALAVGPRFGAAGVGGQRRGGPAGPRGELLLTEGSWGGCLDKGGYLVRTTRVLFCVAVPWWGMGLADTDLPPADQHKSPPTATSVSFASFQVPLSPRTTPPVLDKVSAPPSGVYQLCPDLTVNPKDSL